MEKRKQLTEERKRLEQEKDRLTKQRDDLREDLESMTGSESISDSPVDMRSIREEIRFLDKEIAKLQFRLEENKNYVANTDSKKIGVNDIVKLHVVYSDGYETDIVRKIVKSDPNVCGDLIELSVESPIGKAIINHHVGDKCVFYTKHDRDAENTVMILEKV